MERFEYALFVLRKKRAELYEEHKILLTEPHWNDDYAREMHQKAKGVSANIDDIEDAIQSLEQKQVATRTSESEESYGQKT